MIVTEIVFFLVRHITQTPMQRFSLFSRLDGRVAEAIRALLQLGDALVTTTGCLNIFIKSPGPNLSKTETFVQIVRIAEMNC